MITMKDIHVTNGVVHVIDIPIPLQPAKKTTKSSGKLEKLPACKSTTTGAGKISIIDFLKSSAAHSILFQAIKTAGLMQKLNVAPDEGLTLFAPTNSAWRVLDEQTRSAFLQGHQRLVEMVLFSHIKTGISTSKQLKSGTKMIMQSGLELAVKASGENRMVYIDEREVTAPLDMDICIRRVPRFKVT